MTLLALLMGWAFSGACSSALAGAPMTLGACALLFALALPLARACARPIWMLVVVGACASGLALAKASLVSIWTLVIVGTFGLALARALLRSKANGLHLALLEALAGGRIVDFALASLSATSIADFALALLKTLHIIIEAADLLQAPSTCGIVEQEPLNL